MLFKSQNRTEGSEKEINILVAMEGHILCRQLLQAAAPAIKAIILCRFHKLLESFSPLDECCVSFLQNHF